MTSSLLLSDGGVTMTKNRGAFSVPSSPTGNNAALRGRPALHGQSWRRMTMTNNRGAVFVALLPSPAVHDWTTAAPFMVNHGDE
ncbi:MAG: hypothetical protein MPJ79_01735 [Alphaproteobacteria bacterium]|nr:hypothetical protein [Alphaproteobacteria bacterium]MDA8032423.1 hypothetical protein [Alphaproteobacteria bacterium]